MPTLIRSALLLGSFFLSAIAAANCGFDADSADRLDFAEQIVDCEAAPDSEAPAATLPFERLYDSATGVAGMSVISERRVVAPGSLNHSPGQRFEAREEYSLRADAPFEASVTFAISRLHLQMAHHCSEGWQLDSQRSQPKRTVSDPLRAGKYFLYYQFTCAAR